MKTVRPRSRDRISHLATNAFVMIFIAEWGDLPQILTANVAAHYHSGPAVGV